MASYCPYCGAEDVPADAKQCPRCTAFLDEDAVVEEAPAAAPAKAGAKAASAALPAAPAAKKTEPCPKCEKPVPVTAPRCRACGYAIRDLVSQEDRDREARFQRTIKLGMAGAGALVLLLFLVFVVFKGEEKPKNIEWAKVKFDDLANVFGPGAKSTAGRQKEIWARHGGKFVRWEGRITDIESGAILVRNRAGGGDPDVRVELDGAELEKKGVEVGKRVSYTGRLEKYSASAPAFTLTFGEIIAPKE